MRFYSFIIMLFLSVSSSASMASDLLDMLKHMSEADEKQNYQGVFILRKSDALSTLRVTHGTDEKGVWESLEALNGEPRKVVRHNNSVVSVFPARELVIIRQSENNHSLHRQLPENIDQLEQFYSVHRLADDRIANHHALVVDLVPMDRYRYGYRYWLDKNTGMLLRCDLIADNETVVEQMMFTSLDYLTEAPENRINLQKFENFKQQVIMDDAITDSATSEDYGWVINQLPKGFMLIQSNMRYSQPVTLSDVAINANEGHETDMPNNEVSKDVSESSVYEEPLPKISSVTPPAIPSAIPSDMQHEQAVSTQIQSTPIQPDLLHLVYSDGLASVSVFIKKSIEAESHFEGASSMGAINAYGTFVDDYFVTVVGVVPVTTVQTMAQSAVKSIVELSD